MPLADHWKTLLDAAPDAIFIVDEAGFILYASSHAERLFGYEHDEIVGAPVEIFLPEEFRKEHTNHRNSYMQQPSARPMSMRSSLHAVRKDGSKFPVHVSLRPLVTGTRVNVLASVRDITDLEEARAALERSEQRLRDLIEQMPDAVGVHRDEEFVGANSAMLRSLGYDNEDEFIGTSIWDVIHPDDHAIARQRFDRMNETGIVEPPLEARFIRRDGAVISAEIRDRPMNYEGEPAFVVIGRDISHQKQLLAHAMQLDRKAAVGNLAAGVAHEINNPLAYAKANVQFVLARLERALKSDSAIADEELADSVDALKDTADGLDRIRSIVSDLDTFTDHHGGQIVPIDVEEVLEAAISLVFRQLDSRAHVVRELRRLPSVDAVRGQLAEVFINILTNALQALDGRDPAQNEVRISTACVDGRVTISVRDNGCGMTNEVLASAFDPFFSTRDEGAGSGLGLTIARNILQHLGGGIDIDSTPGEGSAVTVWLPVPEPVGLGEMDEVTQPMGF